MKIIHIITGLGTGGAERVLYNLLNGGLSDRHNNHVISLSGIGTIGPAIQKLGVPVISLNIRGSWFLPSDLVKLRKIVNEIRPDIIQGWMYHGNLAATMARTLISANPKLVWSIHHSLYDLKSEKRLTRLVIRANRFFSSSPDTLLYVSRLSRELHEKFGFYSLNGLVIPNGIDVQQFSLPFASHLRVRNELGIPAEACVIGHVARLHPMKDHPMFLRSATLLALRYPDTHYLLCGKDVSLGNTQLTQMIPAQLLDRFHFLGERCDVSDLMSAMDIFCQSSWSEAFPIVLCEAMSSGLPCVATDVGDSGLIIGDTGVLVPSRDENALIIGIESLIKMPLKARRMLGVSARNRIEANYTLERIEEMYAALYEKLMAVKGEL